MVTRGMTTYQGFLRQHSRSRDTVVAAVADNCRFEERAATDRWRRFESLLPDPAAGRAAIDWQDWAEANQLHLDRYGTVPRPSVPDAFLEINQPAWLRDLSDNQSLVRIETLTRPLGSGALDLDRLCDLMQQAENGDNDAGAAVRYFLNTWNQQRDARPAFAAFYDEVRQEADAPDWPHALRDRLGLGHYGARDGARLPVALMRYSLAEVFAAQTSRQLPVACAIPTVLDGGMHEFFYSVPREHPYGATVHLLPDDAGTITAEILHCRIDYKPGHLWKIGWIERPHQLTDGQLRDARDLHLLTLREECDRPDFGELLDGRT